jgi:ferritin-like metal-binding protein YciE
MTIPRTTEGRFTRLETIVEYGNKRIEEKIDASNKLIEDLDVRTRNLENEFLKAKISGKTLVAVGGVLMTIAGAMGALAAKYLPFLSAAPR